MGGAGGVYEAGELLDAGGERGRSSVAPESPFGFEVAPSGRKTVPEGSLSDGFDKLELNLIRRRGRLNAG
jgi:hypothetical protein